MTQYSDDRQTPSQSETRFETRTRSAVEYIAFAVIASLLMWYAADLVLLAFLSILVAIFLRSLSDPLAEKARISQSLSLALVIVFIIAVLYLAGAMFSSDIAQQLQQLSERLPQALSRLKESFGESELGRQLLQLSTEMDRLLKRPGVLSRATGVLSATFGFFSSVVVVTVGGVFLAKSPKLYIDGTIRLVRPEKRARIREVFIQMHETMRWWLLGKSLSMFLIGVVTGVGLQLLGVQLALVLGLVAGMLAFIPFIGPLFSVIPAVLVSLVESPQLAVYVVLLYAGIQMIESNVVTPIIEKKTVLLPPALTIFAQLLAALLFGFLGVLLASPLTAVAMVLVQTLYVEDKLERSSSQDLIAETT